MPGPEPPRTPTASTSPRYSSRSTARLAPGRRATTAVITGSPAASTSQPAARRGAGRAERGRRNGGTRAFSQCTGAGTVPR